MQIGYGISAFIFSSACESISIKVWREREREREGENIMR